MSDFQNDNRTADCTGCAKGSQCKGPPRKADEGVSFAQSKEPVCFVVPKPSLKQRKLYGDGRQF